VLERSLVDELLTDAMVPQTALMTIDLKTQEIVRASGQTVRFDVPSFVRRPLLKGADEIDMTVQNEAAIESFVAKRKVVLPWL
jgi:3-isopropylmalate/(R)-2-methylmalate dehydratase small subunit